MSKSAVTINYEIRPCKFVERRMLLASLSRILGAIRKDQEYQYIGFGGLTYTDFKMFHRELHIEQMFSIEGGYPLTKLEFNKPFSCIQILNGRSIDVLDKIDLTKPSIIWLDYDDCLSIDVFSELEIVLRAIPHGSIYLMSCNRQMRNHQNMPYTQEELRDIYGYLVPRGLDNDCCTEPKTPYTIKKMIELDCINSINDRNKLLEQKLKFIPIFNFTYEEHRGARMYTYGGIVLNDEFDVNLLQLNTFDFIDLKDPYKIEIPNLTHREIMALNQALNISERERDFIERKIIDEKDVRLYKKCYKYIPNYYDVRL